MLTVQAPLLSANRMPVTKGRGTPRLINAQLLITMPNIKELDPDSAASILYLLTQPKLPPISGNISLHLPPPAIRHQMEALFEVPSSTCPLLLTCTAGCNITWRNLHRVTPPDFSLEPLWRDTLCPRTWLERWICWGQTWPPQLKRQEPVKQWQLDRWARKTC